MKLIQNVMAVLTWPYRSSAQFIDSHPSGSTVKTHAARLEVHCDSNESGVTAKLRVVGTDIIKTEMQSLESTDTAQQRAYIIGVADGAQMIQHSVAKVTRSEFRADSRAVRLASAKRAEAKAAESPAEAPESPAEAVPASA